MNAPSPPPLSVSSASVVEGDSLVFTVTLSEPSTTTVSGRYNTVDGTAVSKANGKNSASDYIATSETLTFAPGETSKTIFVQTIDDGLYEPGYDDVNGQWVWESFSLMLSHAKGAAILDGTGVGMIVDNDPNPYWEPPPGYY
jgi:hypothetical protein